MDIIKDYQKKRHNIILFEMNQTGLPYSDDWNESMVRNFILEKATGSWIANIDVDEVFDDRFALRLPELMAQHDIDVYQFPFVNLWEHHGKSA